MTFREEMLTEWEIADLFTRVCLLGGELGASVGSIIDIGK
jgi:hypothetical protein